MSIERPGFAIKQAAVIGLVLLLAGLYAMRWYTDKKAVETAPKPPVVQAIPNEQPVSPVLPPEASQYTAPDTNATPDESASYLTGTTSKPDLFSKNSMSKSESEKCVQAYSADPRSLAEVLVGNYDNTFYGPHASGTQAGKALLDQYLICVSFTGAMPLNCSNNNIQALCIAAAYDDFIYAALNKDKNPVKCSRFLDLAFAQGGTEGKSPAICGAIRTAVEKRSTAGCAQSGNAAECEKELTFIKGRKACAQLKPDAVLGCESLADMAAGDPGSWLAEVLRTKSQTACSGLGAKLAKTFCDSSFTDARRKAKESADTEKRGVKKAPRE